MQGYMVQNSSTLLDDSVNAIMEVYTSNQTLLRTSSLPEPIVLDDWKGSIQLAITFDDPSLQNVTRRDCLLMVKKFFPYRSQLKQSLDLGEIRPEAISSELK